MADTDVPDGLEVSQVHLVDTDRDPVVLAALEAPISEREGYTDLDRRRVELTTGGPQQLPDGDQYGIAHEDSLQRVVLRDEMDAVGRFLHWVEMTRTSPEMTDEGAKLLSEYNEWVDDLSPADRRGRLVEYGLRRVEHGII